MLKDIKKTAKHTFVYAFGNIATRLIGIILIPLYTNADYLSHVDYGALAVLDATLQLLIGVLTMAMKSGLTRWYWDEKFVKFQKSIFFTTLAFLFSISLISGSVLIIFTDQLSCLLFETVEYSFLLKLTIITAAFQIIKDHILQLAKLQYRSTMFSILQIVKLSLVLTLILWGILVEGKGLEAIWTAYLIGEIVILIILIPYTIRNCKLKFHFDVMKDMIAFGLPLMLASVSGVILATADKYMLSSMSGLEETGVYSLGYKISNTLKIVITASIGSALIPLRTKKMNDPNHHRFYSKNLTYVGFIFACSLLMLSLFSLEALKIFTSAQIYWEANYIVPIIAFALFFGILKDNAAIGIFIKKKTAITGVLIVVTAGLNILLNMALIPIWDIYGAALATLVSQLFLFISLSFASQKVHFIPYEWGKIFKMTVVMIVIISAALLLSDLDVWLRLLIKVLMFMAFPFVLYILKFYDKSEIEIIKNIFHSWKNPKDIKENFKRFLK